MIASVSLRSMPFKSTIVIEPPRLPPWLNAKTAGTVILGLAVLVTGFSSFYTVPVDSVGVQLRFGRYIATTNPGLRFKIPFIDQAIIVPVQRVQKLEFGFGTPGSTSGWQSADSDEQREERSMITGDRNSVWVEWVVQYHVDDPYKYLFAVRSPEDTLRDASESVMREIVGDRTLDEVLTVGRSEIEVEMKRQLSGFSDRYSLGLAVAQVQLKEVAPPPEVRDSFNEVNQSQQERERLINEARGQYNRAVPSAKGQADRLVAEAEGKATRRVNEAEGDAARFNVVFTEYEKAPEVTRQRLYLETMGEVMPHFQKRILMDGQPGSNLLPLLQIDPESKPPARRP